MKVPFIIKAPALGPRGNVRVQAQVRAIDLMPTVLELVGVERPASVQGVSLILLAGKRANPFPSCRTASLITLGIIMAGASYGSPAK